MSKHEEILQKLKWRAEYEAWLDACPVRHAERFYEVAAYDLEQNFEEIRELAEQCADTELLIRCLNEYAEAGPDDRGGEAGVGFWDAVAREFAILHKLEY